ncbi:MAG: DUF5000 domain-containing lipoprotein [Dysgonomonas sp.]
MRTIELKLYIGFLFFAIAVFFTTGCSEDKIVPLENNTTPPGIVANISVVPGPGTATLTYTLPDDQDLLYIKAVYDLQSGHEREVRASYYTNTMLLDGFADENEHEVKVYAVNRSEVASDPVTVKVTPLENPIWAVTKSLKIVTDFGGFRLSADNPSKADLVIDGIRKDSLGKWVPYENIYTSAMKIKKDFRGLDTIPYSFAFVVRDRFLNYTDTVFADLTPYYETLMDRLIFRELRLPGDAELQINESRYGIPQIWDGNTNHTTAERLMTKSGNSDPCWITFDMGQSAMLNRITIYNYSEWMGGANPWLFYYRGQMRFFEVWGSLDYPPADGSWNGWVRLGEFENIKPSGLPYGSQNNDDWEAAVNGFQYNFDLPAPKVRYIRIKSIQNWQGTSWLDIQEVKLYGDNR